MNMAGFNGRQISLTVRIDDHAFDMGILRRSIQRIVPRATNPLFLGQVASSIAGAVPMFIGVGLFDTESLVVFSLMTLILSIAVGTSRAALYRPALVVQRADPNAFVPLRYGVVCSVLLSSSSVPIFWVVGLRGWQAITIAAISLSLALLYEWARSRAIADDRRWLVVVGDGVRLLGVVALIPAARWLQTPELLFAGVCLAAFVGLLATMFWLRPKKHWSRFSAYRRQSALQTVEYGVSQLATTVPLLFLGGVGATELIAGVRFAQTLLGPLNLIFSAAGLNLLANGATRASHREVAQLVAAGRAASRSLLLSGVIFVGAILSLVLLVPSAIASISREALMTGAILVGAVAVLSGWSGIQAVVLRLVGRQKLVTTSRLALVAWTWIGFLAGFWAGGVDWSVIGGFVFSAIGYPLFLGIPGRRALARLRDQSTDATDDGSSPAPPT
jgi:hypothetical protein